MFICRVSPILGRCTGLITANVYVYGLLRVQATNLLKMERTRGKSARIFVSRLELAINYSIDEKAVSQVSLKFSKTIRYGISTNCSTKAIHWYRHSQAKLESTLCNGPVRGQVFFDAARPETAQGLRIKTFSRL